jgi:hypothetical protein
MSATVSLTRGTLPAGSVLGPADERSVASRPIDFAEVSFALDGLAGLRQLNQDCNGFGPVALGENHLKTAVYSPDPIRTARPGHAGEGTSRTQCRLARIYARMERVMRLAVQSLLLGLAFGPGLAVSSAAEDFYKGKTITLVVANAEGGGEEIAQVLQRLAQSLPALIRRYKDILASK